MEQKARYHRETVNGGAFRMRYLDGGVFEMGSDETRKSLGKENPIHKVELSSFYTGEYPVTQALWKAVMGADHNPSRFIRDNRPVERVSWIDIVEGNQDNDGQPAFLQKLNEWTKTSRPKGYAYRLPTEAEWEYAARGGEQVRMDAARGSEPYEYAGSDQLKEVGWFSENSHSETKAVGLKRPNGFQLFDMSGNEEEWCVDKYSDTFYQECYERSTVKNPNCQKEDARYRLARGGSWGDYLRFCRVSFRDYRPPTDRDGILSFRLVLASA
ncbi:formylglycine-generating enzyme family protein [Phaeodactylibacter xiamenensis]|nr:SUMF1/EgtB/PvdO family nonheme iron enzyme [Phaeodactylibacter xiamenensis]